MNPKTASRHYGSYERVLYLYVWTSGDRLHPSRITDVKLTWLNISHSVCNRDIRWSRHGFGTRSHPSSFIIITVLLRSSINGCHRPRWLGPDVWIGAAITGALYTLVSMLIFHLGHSALVTFYGGAGSFSSDFVMGLLRLSNFPVWCCVYCSLCQPIWIAGAARRRRCGFPFCFCR